MNFPAACGGVVNPGDIIVADEEGIVVIPQADAEDVYQAWRKIVDREKAWRAAAAGGQQAGGDEVDTLLAQIKSEIIA